MSIEYVDVLRMASEEHTHALRHGNPRMAQHVVRHVAEVYGLPDTAAESMLHAFRHPQ